MKKEIWYYLLSALFLASIIIGILILVSQQKSQQIQKVKQPTMFLKSYLPKIAVIDISGPVYYSDSTGWFSMDARYISTKLKDYAEDSQIKGILLRINSPGGSVGAVQQIYRQVMKVRLEHKKPVVCFVPEICASGGYYIASAADKIVSSPGAIIGSIGVILQLGNISGLFKKIGVNVEVIKSSKYKDIGSMYRDVLPEERKILESLVNSAFEQFVNDIALGRNLDKNEVLNFADGRILIAQQAKELKMIDELGDEDTAVEILKQLAGITGKVNILKEPRTIDIFRYLINAQTYIQKNLFHEYLSTKKFRFEYIFE